MKDRTTPAGPMAFPSDAEIYRSVEAKVEALFQEGGIEKLREVFTGYPEPPTEPGLYALVAPDEVVVKTVDRTISQKELKSLVIADIAKRMLRSFYEQCVAEGRTYEQTSESSFEFYMGLKRQYRLDRLSKPLD
jgi:hypothetical protein